ncbi:MAG: LITAF-like zinc ribbon domain-containing protein [archaeon]|nr:LITAF-like zinc ribbon domain-containing protein [archaeon]
MQGTNSYKQVNQSMSQEMPQQQTISPISNQMSPDPINMMACHMNLKSNSQFVVCPYCKQITPTRTEKKISFKNLLLCLCCSPTVWAGVQIFRQKDLSCFDAKHYCLRCNALLADYSAC